VTWFYGTNLEERLPVNISSQAYIRTLFERSASLPENWSQLGDDQFVYNNQENTKSAYPLPVLSSQSQCLVSARYLFCRTTRAYFRSKLLLRDNVTAWLQSFPQLSTVLQDSDGLLVGHLNINLGLMDYIQPPDNTKFELVAISSGALKSYPEANFFEVIFEKYTKPGDVVHFYYVLWIEWIDGIAYRKGLGRILKEAWDREATEEIDFILG
jgi:hypothetical protein